MFDMQPPYILTRTPEEKWDDRIRAIAERWQRVERTQTPVEWLEAIFDVDPNGYTLGQRETWSREIIQEIDGLEEFDFPEGADGYVDGERLHFPGQAVWISNEPPSSWNSFFYFGDSEEFRQLLLREDQLEKENA